MEETFAIPAVCAIIEKEIDGIPYILIQERAKNSNTEANGLLEIPAGKVRQYENVFDALRREIKEETNLEITEISGENESKITECNGYKVIGFQPFYSSQNLDGIYSIINQTFICKATGELLTQSDESINIRWIKVSELKDLLLTNEAAFFALNVNALKKYIESNSSLGK